MEKTKAKKWFLIKLSVIIIFFFVLTLCFVWARPIERLLNFDILGNVPPVDLRVFDGGLKISFVDVGQGDATVIDFPTGEVVIIDSGDTNLTAQTNFRNYLDDKVFVAGRERVIDWFFATHAHADHIGNAKYLLENYEIKNVLRPITFSEYEINNFIFADFGLNLLEAKNVVKSQTFDDFAIAMQNATGTNIELPTIGRSINVGDGKFSLFPPRLDQINEEDENENSTVILFEFGNRKALFTGDATAANEASLLEIGFDNINAFGKTEFEFFTIDILDVGHHGSYTSTTEEWLEFFRPEYAVIQVGADNTYGHPHAATQSRLKNSMATVLRTDTMGNIEIYISEQGLQLYVANIPAGKISLPYWALWLMLTFALSFVTVTSTIRYRKQKKA